MPAGAQALEVRRAEHDQREAGREGDDRDHERGAEPGGGVADERDRVRDRSRRDLPVGDGVGELLLAHPALRLDGVAVHQRDDHVAAAVRERADLEREPDQRGPDRAQDHVARELRQPAQQQHDDHVRAGEDRAERAGDDVGEAAARIDQLQSGLHDDGDDRRGRAGPEALDPRGRLVAERERGDQQHRDQPGDDEREATDQRASPAGHALGGVDRHLRARRAGQQAAGGERVLELARVDPLAPLDGQIAQQRDVRGRPAEAEHADAAPLASHRGKGGEWHGPHTYRNGTAL